MTRNAMISGALGNRPVVRKRMAELVRGGMEESRAREQAVAEFEKGVLARGCCVGVDDDRTSLTTAPHEPGSSRQRQRQ